MTVPYHLPTRQLAASAEAILRAIDEAIDDHDASRYLTQAKHLSDTVTAMVNDAVTLNDWVQSVGDPS